MKTIIKTIAVLHNQNICHCDLKPRTIFSVIISVNNFQSEYPFKKTWRFEFGENMRFRAKQVIFVI